MALTLHFHPLSSFCHKALIALYENDTPFQKNIVNLMDPGEAAAFKALWPCGQFPVLQDGDRTIPELSVIIEHLDLHHPGKTRFIPADPERASAGAAQGSLLRPAPASAHAEGGRRPAAPGRQERPARASRMRESA